MPSYTRQSRYRDCLVPRPVYVKMIYLPDETEPCVTVVAGTDGRIIPAAYLHWQRGEVMHHSTVAMQPDEKIHLFLSDIPCWYHVVEVDRLHQKYRCSCRDGVDYVQSGRTCEHIEQMLAKEAK